MPETPTPHHPFTAARAGHLVASRYRLTSLIASGGMAEVWEAVDEVLERPVAVKILHPHLAADESFTLRFRAEALAAARLHHPSIVSIYDTCHADGLEAIVMELVRGRTLRSYLDERGRLDPVEVVHIGADVADALEAAHRAGVIHRDVKPANILLCDDARVLVTDFGIAKVRDDSDMTSTGTMLGSVKYLAPEQVEGLRVDPRTDVYALGVVLYEALVGTPPFVAETIAATALARLHQDPVPVRRRRGDVPESLGEVVERSLARSPGDRFPSAADQRAALLATRLDAGVRATGTPPSWDDTRIEPSPTTTTTTTTDLDADPWGREVMTTSRAGATLATPADPPARARPRRPLLPALVVLALVAVALGVAALLAARSEPGHDLLARVDPPNTEPVPSTARITAVTAFDPQGSGAPGENNQLAPLAVDGDAHTGWQTEGYTTRTFGNLKQGLGLVAVLDRSTPLRSLRVSSPTNGWAASVYVGDGTATNLAGWGKPVATGSAIDGSTTFDLAGARGDHVLVWIVDLGDGPPLVSAEIDELVVTR